MIGEYTEDFLRSRAAEFVTQKTEHSKILNAEQESMVPRFDANGA